MSGPTTALVVLAPHGEQLLDLTRAEAPDTVRALPAHVTLLYPGPDPAEFAEVRAELAALVPEELELAELETGPDGFVAVTAPALEPALAFCRRRWPDHLPYGGRFGRPAAHLTLGMGGTEAQVRAVGAAVGPRLPVRTGLSEPLLAGRGAEGWEPSEAQR